MLLLLLLLLHATLYQQLARQKTDMTFHDFWGRGWPSSDSLFKRLRGSRQLASWRLSLITQLDKRTASNNVDHYFLNITTLFSIDK